MTLITDHPLGMTDLPGKTISGATTRQQIAKDMFGDVHEWTEVRLDFTDGTCLVLAQDNRETFTGPQEPVDCAVCSDKIIMLNEDDDPTDPATEWFHPHGTGMEEHTAKPATDELEDDPEPVDTCKAPDGHWYAITYGAARWQIHADDCDHPDHTPSPVVNDMHACQLCGDPLVFEGWTADGTETWQCTLDPAHMHIAGDCCEQTVDPATGEKL